YRFRGCNAVGTVIPDQDVVTYTYGKTGPMPNIALQTNRHEVFGYQVIGTTGVGLTLAWNGGTLYDFTGGQRIPIAVLGSDGVVYRDASKGGNSNKDPAGGGNAL